MRNARFLPKLDRLFWLIAVPVNVLLAAVTVLMAIFEPTALFIVIPVLLLVNYFLVSPLFGYVELRDGELFVKYGFFLKRSIPYAKIRSLKIEKKWYSDSMLSLKSSMEHVRIGYNRFDVTCVSVKENEALVKAVEERIAALR